MPDRQNEIDALRTEVDRLRGLLDANGIEWRPMPRVQKSALTLEERVALFRSLFRGREDVFARRWFSRTSGKSGYQPVCRCEWHPLLCDKKKLNVPTVPIASLSLRATSIFIVISKVEIRTVGMLWGYTR